MVLKRRPPPGIEADTRRRLADTLDVLGRAEEAAAEREQAGAVAMKAATDPMALTAQGDLLERQGRHDDACFCFEQALKSMPNLPGGGRALIMAKLALAHHQAGRSTETLRWAQKSLANGPDKTVKPLMHRMAGVALSDQGDLEQAEVQHRLSLELMEKAGKPKEIAEGLVMLASLQKQRGHYEEAITAARRSREIARSPSRTDLAVEAECLRDMGRFDEARDVMRQHFDGPRFDQPHLERRMQALGSLGMAWIEARAEQPEAAWQHLEAAREGLKIPAYSTSWPPPPDVREEKLALWCDATAVNILTQQGHNPEARRLRDSIESRLPSFAADNATLRGTYGHLARASLRLGDLTECQDYCRRYENCNRLLPFCPPFTTCKVRSLCVWAKQTQPARHSGRRSRPALTAWMPAARRHVWMNSAADSCCLQTAADRNLTYMSFMIYNVLYKEIVWLHGEIHTPPFSHEARVEAGHRLRLLQQGQLLSMPQSRPLPILGARCHELRLQDQDVTWRIVYRVDVDAVVIADVFVKKTQTTPQDVLENCRRRLSQYDSA